ncbi:hypothetical protein CC78DRAFT_460946, partial [Lojkania enalia]
LAVLTPKVLLVPYSVHHVPIYHEWMKDEDLQKATASEPLTLTEEYEMQKSWREDADKLTFIVCKAPESRNFNLIPGREDGPEAMTGDVNLFLSYDEDDHHGEAQPVPEKERRSIIGEVEIMIACKDYQGQGLGKNILLLFFWYIFSSLTEIAEQYHPGSYVSYLRVKIGAENVRSIKLFESVGFTKVSETPNYFRELELRWPVTEGRIREIENELGTIPLIVEYK